MLCGYPADDAARAANRARCARPSPAHRTHLPYGPSLAGSV